LARRGRRKALTTGAGEAAERGKPTIVCIGAAFAPALQSVVSQDDTLKLAVG
jgi:hypothetical protein